MLTLFRSHRIEALVEVLARRLDDPAELPDDPFRPARVIVGSTGMERWLRHQLSVRLAARIVSNVVFPFPAQVLAEVLADLEKKTDGVDAADAAAAPSPGTLPDPWRPEALSWRILELLPGFLEDDGDPVTAPLRDYLAARNDDEENDEGDRGEEASGVVRGKELSLALELADLLDQYITYRPQMVEAWSRGQTELPEALAGAAGWQPRLWSLLRHQLNGAPHPARRWSEALAGARAPCPTLDEQPLRIFGVASLPPVFLERLAALSQRAAVELYLLVPSPSCRDQLAALGGEALHRLREVDRNALAEEERRIRPAHPLLRSLGRVSRDMQIVLESLGDGELRREAVNLDRDADEGAPTTVLGRLQADIRQQMDPSRLSAEELEARAIAPGDDSLQFHSCYAPIRQVEVLRETLLHLFQSDPGLEPRDVLVMTPEIETYVPLVSAVFDRGRERPLAEPPPGPGDRREGEAGAKANSPWGPAGAPRIPYQFTERSLRRVNPVAEALLRALELAAPGARLTASAFLDLLGVEPFRRRFGLSSADVDRAAAWIGESGVRWGTDAEDRAHHHQPPASQNTWRFGLERLCLGVVMADAPGRLFDPPPGDAPRGVLGTGVAPFDALEGGEVVLLGKLMDAYTTLVDEVRLLREPRSAADWLRRLMGDGDAPAGSPERLGTVGRLTEVSAAAGWLLVRVRQTLLELQQDIEEAGSARLLDSAALATALAGRFEVASGATSANTGAVTFASLVPFRGVPFKVVCLLGMDDAVFPRRPSRRHFDIVQRLPRVGDRDPGEEDRQLLLEAILAARKHLLLLWNGRDVRTNEPLAPAVPLGELQEVLDRSFPPRKGQRPARLLCREHPLQPFSPRCFDPKAPWSYDLELQEGAARALKPERAVPDFFAPPDATADRAETAPGEGCEADAGQAEAQVEAVTLDALIWFFRNPLRTLLKRGLNLYLDDDTELAEVREPVDPKLVDAKPLANALLAARRAQMAARAAGDPPPPPAPDRARLAAEGLLPLGRAGDRALERSEDLVKALLEAAEPWIGSEDAPVAPDEALTVRIEETIEGTPVRLEGQLGPLFGRDALFLSVWGGEGTASVVAPWLVQLCWAAEEPKLRSSSVLWYAKMVSGVARASGLRYAFRPKADADEREAAARKHLRWLLGLYLRGQRERLPLLPKTSWKLAWELRPGQKGEHLAAAELEAGPPFDPDVVRRLRAVRGKVEGAYWGRERPEAEDPHVRLAYGHGAPFVDAGGPAGLDLGFVRLALGFWEPCLQSRSTGPKPLGPREVRR